MFLLVPVKSVVIFNESLTKLCSTRLGIDQLSMRRKKLEKLLATFLPAAPVQANA